MKPTTALLLSLVFLPATTHAAFSDVPDDHPYTEAVAYVQAEGIVQGYEDGTYKPEALVNRAEFTKIVIGALYERELIEKCTDEIFDDVPAEVWFFEYVCMAAFKDIIGGYKDGTFRPGQPISFVEAAKVLVLAFELHYGKSAVWYEGFVRTLFERNAIPMSISSLEHQVTRGEMAELIYRLRADVFDRPSASYGQLLGSDDSAAEEWVEFTNEVYNYTISHPAFLTPQRSSSGATVYFVHDGIALFAIYHNSTEDYPTADSIFNLGLEQRKQDQSPQTQMVKEPVTVADRDAVMATYTAPDKPNFIMKLAILIVDGQTYELADISSHHPGFDRFLESFRLH